MSYTVTVRGGDIYHLDDSDGFDLKAAWLDSKKPFPCELGDDTVMSSQIMKITRNKVTQADIPNFTQPTLASSRRCKGQYSIQLEINRMAKEMSGKESDDNPNAEKWMRLIGDKDWRGMIYHKLRETGALWCDDRTNECACEDGFIALAGRHNV